MGVTLKTIQPGDGCSYPKKGDRVTVHYIGTFTDGTMFDSSRDLGSPFVCNIGIDQLIKGWDEGTFQMSVGERVKLACTPDYPYGPHGYPNLIPSNATLFYDAELITIN